MKAGVCTAPCGVVNSPRRAAPSVLLNVKRNVNTFTISTLKKLRVGVIYGGRSGEHEVSVASAASIMKHLDRGRYEPVPIRIEKDGRWTLADRPPTSISAADVIEHARVEAARPVRPGREAHLVAHPGEETVLAIERRAGADIDAAAKVTGVGLDVVLPVLHGPYGDEDAVSCRRSTRRPLPRRTATRVGEVSRGGFAQRRRAARLPGVRQAGQSRLQRRHL